MEQCTKCQLTAPVLKDDALMLSPKTTGNYLTATNLPATCRRKNILDESTQN